MPELNVPGVFNVSNAACALAAAELMGVDPRTALRDAYGHLPGRAFRHRPVRSHDGPAAAGQEPGRLGRGAAAGADRRPSCWRSTPLPPTAATCPGCGTSTTSSWPDGPWSPPGRRAQDLAVRLRYAGVEHRCVPDLAAALAGHPEPVDVIATYTPFQRLRKMGGVR